MTAHAASPDDSPADGIFDDMADGIFDAHFHVIDPAYPLEPNDGYLPPPFSADDYLARARREGVTGGALVSGSFQGTDQAYLLAALRRLGGGFVGVTNLPQDASDALILELDAGGVRAVRVNLFRGSPVAPAVLEELARRVHSLAGWHTELYLDGADLPDLAPVIRRLPAVSIDHLGLRAAGFDTLLRLVADGVWAKASGFGRLDFDPAAALVRLAAVRPDRIVFGTDLPSTRAARPFDDGDVRLVRDVLDAPTARAVLRDNARSLYRLR